MKTTSLFALSAVVGLGVVFGGCSDSPLTPPGDAGGDTGTTPTDGGGNPDGSDGSAPCAEVLEGAVGDAGGTGGLTTDKTLKANCQYLLKGLYMVKAPATLTIEAGTVIRGDKNTKGILLVQKGAKVRMMGTADAPVVFTSANSADPKSGDWGGIVILGSAPVNLPNSTGNVEGIVEGANGSDTSYGGNNAADSSGEIHYTRVEYGGVVLSNNNEVNGITFAGVGSGTVLDHIDVRFALDDCFEFFGGTVNAKYLACQSNEDDAFDFDNGFSGKLQFLVLQSSQTHDGEDNAFESDNDATGTTNMPLTAPTVYNATLCGKNADLMTAVSYGWLVRRNTRGKYFNIAAMGFDAGLDLRDTSTATGATNSELDIQSSILFGMKAASTIENIAPTENGAGNDGMFDEVGWFKTGAKKNAWSTDPGIPGCFNLDAPSFGPTASLTANAATPPNDGFFDATAAYIGAFKDANDKWATTGKWAKWASK